MSLFYQLEKQLKYKYLSKRNNKSKSTYFIANMYTILKKCKHINRIY